MIARAARVLAAPGADLGAIEDAVVVGVHLVEAGSGPLLGAILGALDILIPGDAAGRRCGRARGRNVDGGGLRAGSRLGKARCWKEQEPDKGSNEG